MTMMNITRRLSTSSPKTVVELFYDIVSPYTFIQFELLNRQKSQWQSMDLQLTPTSIKSIFMSAENAPPMMVPLKGLYLMQDLKNVTKFHKVNS